MFLFIVPHIFQIISTLALIPATFEIDLNNFHVHPRTILSVVAPFTFIPYLSYNWGTSIFAITFANSILLLTFYLKYGAQLHQDYIASIIFITAMFSYGIITLEKNTRKLFLMYNKA